MLPYKFEPPPAGRGGRGGGGGADTTAGRGAAPAVSYNPQPICAVLAANIYADDLLLSVAHQYQSRTAWHRRRPAL